MLHLLFIWVAVSLLPTLTFVLSDKTMCETAGPWFVPSFADEPRTVVGGQGSGSTIQDCSNELRQQLR